MNDNSVDSAISELLYLRRDSRLSLSPTMKDQVNHLLLELRFLELYTQCLAQWNEALQDKKNRHLKKSKNLHIKATIGGATKGFYRTGITSLRTQDFQHWESLASELLEKVQLCKPKIREDCLDFLDCSFQYKFSSFELQKFYSCLSVSLNELVWLKADTILDLKIQIQGIKERLQLFMQILEFNPSIYSSNKVVKDFKILIQIWLHNAACLSLLYWIIEENKEEIECRKKIFLSTPRITRMLLDVLKSLWSSLRDRLLLHEGVLKFADFFLEILQVCPLKADVETLHSELIFLTTFLVDPPLAEDAESISKKVESLIYSLSADELKGTTAKKCKVLVNTFLEEMNRISAKVRKLYAQDFQDSSSYNFPTTNVLGFVDSHLENLKGISKHSTNHQVVIVQEELQLLRPSLKTILKLQEEHLEIKDLWTRAVLKSLWSSLRDRLLMHKGVLKFADFFLEILQIFPLKDDIETLHSELIFLITFLVDPALAEDAGSISKEVESLIYSLSANELKGTTAKKSKVLVNSFLEEMNRVSAKVRKLYALDFLDSSSYNFPSTNVLGFVDSLLENLKGISEHSTNHQVVIVQEELQLLRPSLQTTLKLQEEHLEIKDLWTRIVNVVYQAKIGIQLLLYANNSVWYDVKRLSDVTDNIKLLKSKIDKMQDQVTDKIKLLKSEIDKIQDQEIYNIKVPVAEKPTSPAQANIPKIDEVFVGFEDESKTIIDLLMGNSQELVIVSIFGMPGLGKTTLAKKIYNDPSVQKQFTKRAWCCVSQTPQTKKLLLEILSGIVLDDDLSTKDEEELAHILLKQLCGQRYLIVMDDIWDIKAWAALKLSFPDKKNGSRIIFTSRNQNVASEAEHYRIPHRLRQLSFDESLELLKRKLFGEKDFPQHFKDIGEQIAKDCNGLPLAVVVIAGILSEKVDNLDWWNHIAKSIPSWANEGCTDILELSYKNLPEYLKPCFLYIGAFQDDRAIRVRKLIQLWISEGFVQKCEGKNLEDVAKEYLTDLVVRSLVVVTRRSSSGWIKACRIHDLLHEFCLEKVRKENFLQVERWSEPSSNSTDAVLKNYRICIQTGLHGFLASNPSGPCVHSLLFVPDYSFYMNEWEFFPIGNFKLLQVLDLEDIEFDGYFPEEVVLLVLLRYLAIWCTHGALSIPSSILNLRNLETFRVKRYSRFGNAVCLPNTIWTMKRLRHIDVGESTVSFSDDCEPQESSRLDNIQTFSAPSLCHGEAAEKLLRRLPNVQKLRCQFDDSWDPHKECNQLPILDFDQSVLESLNVVYTGKLFHHGAFSFPSTLKKLTLADFKLPWSRISTIGKLPQLEILKLLDDSFTGETWDLKDDEFLTLKFLKLSNLNIAEWNSGDNPFPHLEQLIVEDCHKLEEIPSDFAESINTLKRIEVRWCNDELAESARQIREYQIELGNKDMKVIVVATI